MNKIMMITGLLITLCACKKERTCSCTTIVSYQGGSSVYRDDAKAFSKKMNEKTAKSACEAKRASIDASYRNVITDNGSQPSNGVSASTTCDLR